MGASPITTPPQAQQLFDLSNTQFNAIRAYFGINDFPYKTDKTYIVFDADAGNNDLHIDTVGSTSYSILKGDGTIETSYTDTGGTKVLNYAVAGRYLITIDGTFNGIDTTGAATAAKDKYISVVGGSNYPTTIVLGAFQTCRNIRYISFDYVTTISDLSFNACNLLLRVYLPIVTGIGSSFFTCLSLESVFMPLLTSITSAGFGGCSSLSDVNLPELLTIGNGGFGTCISLTEINLPKVTSIGDEGFKNCVSLISLIINYSAGLTVGTDGFSAVKLADLYPIGAGNSTNATAVQTKLSTAGMAQLNAYRLLY